jgi:Amidohydrolase family
MLNLLFALFLSLLPRQDVTAFVGVSVIPMDQERVLENFTVVVSGGEILAMGPKSSTTIPEGTIQIDGRGKFLMPGLAEMHGHIPPPNRPAEEIENTLFLYLANGITTVRGMLGYPGQLDLRAAASSGQLDSPNLYLAGPSFSGSTVTSPSQAADRTRQQIEEGWDLLKVHPGLTRTEYDSMAVAAARGGIDFGGHVPADVGLEHALSMGQLTFDHLDGYVEYLFGVDPDGINEPALGEIVDKTIQAGAWVVPTMVLWETLFGVVDLDDLNAFPELAYVSEATRASWERQFRGRVEDQQFNRRQNVRVIEARMRVLTALNTAGAGILMGTDAPQQYSVPGFSLHREMQRMVDAGMTPYQVLRSGTVNVGTYFSAWDTFGQIAPGHRADLLLLNSNPLVSIASVADRAGVMVAGRWHAHATIEARLAKIAASFR